MRSTTSLFFPPLFLPSFYSSLSFFFRYDEKPLADGDPPVDFDGFGRWVSRKRVNHLYALYLPGFLLFPLLFTLSSC